MTDMDTEQIVNRCMARLLIRYAFWGALGLSLELVKSRRTPTLATDEIRLFYNPHYVHNEEEEILCTGLAHEIAHKFFRDCSRRGARDPSVWNQATDYRINLMLKDSGLKLGDNYLIDERFRGMDAEEIYDLLMQDPPPSPPCGEGGSDGQGEPDDQEGKSKPNCGCGGLLEKPDIEGDGGNPAPLDFGEASDRIDLANAIEFARMQGKLPASIEEMVKEILSPKIRWQDILRRFMEMCDQDDFSWLSPDRRFLNNNVYLPNIESEGVDTFVLAIDSSGSTIPFMPNFLGEASEIAKVLKFNKLYVMYCDAAVYHVDEYSKGELPIKPLMEQKRGGTDFRPVFSWLEERGVEPKGMVYLTDTFGAFPKVPPTYPVLWAVPGNFGRVEFGEMLDIT